ncbi:MAG: spore coat protein [Thermoflavifilum sp.]|nr:spore coat protein [Thermoflavifilum sp.]MCL6515239.1 spore coat protein [Alicyclobacillus sp.]
MQQQQMTGGLQPHPTMQTPPAVITTKDLQYLRDMMSWELLAAKKCSHFASECTDPQLRTVIDKVGQMHLRHYALMLKHCKNNNNQAMPNVPAPPQMQ